MDDTADHSERGDPIISEFLKSWRMWQSRVLQLMRRDFSHLIPSGEPVETIPRAGRLLRDEGLWEETGGVERLAQLQRIYEEIDERGIERVEDLTTQQAAQLRAFVARDEKEQRDLFPPVMHGRFADAHLSRAEIKLKGMAQALAEGADEEHVPWRSLGGYIIKEEDVAGEDEDDEGEEEED